MLVDIIIPAYNPGKELVEAVKSCFNQSEKDFNIVVIDDNSSSDVKRLLWDFPGVNIIKNDTNLGPAGARNVGIKNSKADFISFLDADDLMHKDKIKNTLKCFSEKTKASMVCGNYQVIMNRKKLLAPFYKRPIKINHKSLMRQNFVASGSVTLKRACLDDVGLFDESLWVAEDYDLWLRISEKYEIEYLHKVLYYYSVVKDGKSLTQRDDLKGEHIKNLTSIKLASAARISKARG